MVHKARWFFSLLAIFFATRLVILGISLAAFNNFQLEKCSRPWSFHIQRLWSNFDVGWYKKVAAEGYEREPFSREEKKNWAFMPLYPFLLRKLLWLFHGPNFFYFATAFSSLCAILALALFGIVYKNVLQSQERFFFLYLASAGSFYLSIPYNESLALLLMACTWLLVKKEYPLSASFVAGLGAITRVQLLGLIAIPFIPLLLKKELGRSLASVLLFSVPLLAYMGYMHHVSGRATAYFDMQYAWGNTHPYPLESFVVFLKNGWENGPCQWIHLLFWGVFGTCWVRNYRSIPLSESIFCWVIFLISTSCEVFYGAYRYVLLLVPLYVACANEKEWFKTGFIYFNLILGTLYIIVFVNDKYFVL